MDLDPLTFCLLLLPLWESVIVLCFFCMLLYVHSSIAIILMGKRELVALLNLSSWCLVMVERLFLAVPWGCLWFVIAIFPDHTHLLFWIRVCRAIPAISVRGWVGCIVPVFCLQTVCRPRSGPTDSNCLKL